MTDLITAEEAGKLLDAVKADRDVGTEDHWWHSRICDFYLADDFGAYDDQKACDKRRILRVPALERTVIALHADRDRLAAANAALEAQVARLVYIRNLPDDIEQQVKVTREYAADSGMDKHQIELMAICTSHFLDAARQLRAALAEVQADAQRKGDDA